MTAFVDTNVLIRHLTGDPPDMAVRATSLLAGGERLLLSDLMLADETDRLDFAEAYLVAQAEASGVAEVVSFDRSIDRVGSVTRREP